MKLDQLRKIIREEVRSAVKEELQEVMNEAVKAASAPTTYTAPSKTIQVETQQPIRRGSVFPPPTNPIMGKKSIDEMLHMTKTNMTNEEYKTIFSGNAQNAMAGVPTPTGAPRQKVANSLANQMNMVGTGGGIDISQLDFVKNAGAVLKASNEKDKQKAGIV